MNNRFSIRVQAAGALLAAVAVLAGTATANAASTRPTASVCAGSFEADLTRGPDADLSLVGDLTVVDMSDGKVVGVVTRPDETTHKPVTLANVAGTVSGGQVRLAFTTRSGLHLNGVGALGGLHRCSGTLSGTLTASGGTRGVWGDALPVKHVTGIIISAPSFYY